MRGAKYKTVEMDIGHLKGILERATMSDCDRADLVAAIDTLAFMTRELEKRRTSVGRLRQMLFGANTEKTRTLLARIADAPASSGAEADDESPRAPPPGDAELPPADAGTGATPKLKRKGHGRNGAKSYRGAQRVEVAHESLKDKDPCPACDTGKLYAMKVPAILVRITGRAPLGATIYACERLRCNACGEVFAANVPDEAGAQKYDESAGAIIGLLKYGTGFPFYRLDRLQKGFGIPLPAGTQWQIVEQAAQALTPAHEELIRQAAQGEVLHNDDTTAKILALMAARARRAASGEDTDSERTGVFTTGIIATGHGLRIALYFTGTNHAGENLAELLKQRASELAPPIQMCDALSRNYSGDFKTILANCLSHGRRKFVDVIVSFPQECKYVIETLRDVYHNDSIAAERKMSAGERLAWHKKESAKPMRELREWLDAQLAEKKVEPNSGLGEAIQYMIKHWDKLTLFLRVAGAPLDNNICERALKKAILNRKNAYFFKTENGARVSDAFMSLIHTAELCHADPFDYLVTLLRHAEQVRVAPGQWMPWNYLDTLAERDGPDARLCMTG